MPNNFERMLVLVGEVFDVKNDPDQIDVDDSVMAKLRTIHRDTMSEFSNQDGPVAWILLIPTTVETMNSFVAGSITERQLLAQTEPGMKFEALYLCSATVLPEFRHKGIARQLTLKAITAMRLDFPISALYFWKFSDDGARLSAALATSLGLPLFERIEPHRLEQ